LNSKRNPAPSNADEPVEVFRQFAWHLAGTLAIRSGAAPRTAKPARSGKR
jgi:hypothetical protein